MCPIQTTLSEILRSIKSFMDDLVIIRRDINDLRNEIFELKLSLASHIDKTIPYTCKVV